MTPPTPSKASLLLRCLYTHTHTPAHNVSCTLCVYRESERLPPTQTRALFLAGMLLLLACRWRSVHLCTCPSLSPSLSVYLRFICSSLLSSFAKLSAVFFFYFIFFLNHLTRLPGGCNITTTTNSTDTGQQQRRRLRLRRRRQQPMMVICFAAF